MIANLKYGHLTFAVGKCKGIMTMASKEMNNYYKTRETRLEHATSYSQSKLLIQLGYSLLNLKTKTYFKFYLYLYLFYSLLLTDVSIDLATPL